MTSNKDSHSPEDATAPKISTENLTSAGATVDAPATGYVYATDELASAQETNEAVAAASLSGQLLQNGETVEDQPKVLKEDAKSAVPGTAVGGLKGERAEQELNTNGTPVLPTSSRTTELSRGSKKKIAMPVAALSAGVVAVVAGGVAYAMLTPSSTEQEPVDTPTTATPVATTATASPTPTAAPSPSITERVPEVKYVEPTEVAVEPGYVEYVEPTVEATPEETYVEEVLPTETATPEAVEVVPTEVAVTQDPAAVVTQAPLQTYAPTTEQTIPQAVTTTDATQVVIDPSTGLPIQVIIDPSTGLPVQVVIDPYTGLPVQVTPTADTGAYTQTENTDISGSSTVTNPAESAGATDTYTQSQ